MTYFQDVEKYLYDYCTVTKQYSQNTIRNYRNTLERFGVFLAKNNINSTNQIDKLIVLKYRNYLEQKLTLRKGKLNKKSQSYQVVVLRSFLNFMQKEGVLVLKPESLELPKVKNKIIEFLEETEIKKLIQVIEKDKDLENLQKARNKAIILTIYGSGLRISELLNLQKKDLENENRRLMIQGKGGKVRTTYLAPMSFKAILEYLRLRRDDNPFLFVNHSKNQPADPKEYRPITPRMVQIMLKYYAKSMGTSKNITPHTLRHSFATKLLLKGGDIRSVQTILGHANIATTQVYTHITDTKTQELHQKVFGDNDLVI